MSNHLGDRVAALVDGELDHEARERALTHLSGCAECREEVEAQRRLKAVLSTPPTGYVPPAVSDLLRYLPPPEPSGMPGARKSFWPTSVPWGAVGFAPASQPLPRSQESPLVRPIPHPWRARRVFAAATFTAAVGAIAVTGLVGGSGAPRTQQGPSAPQSPAVYVAPRPTAESFAEQAERQGVMPPELVNTRMLAGAR